MMRAILALTTSIAASQRWIDAATTGTAKAEAFSAAEFLGLAQLGTPPPVAGNNPNSVLNVADYEIAQPTPPPSMFGGTYCRGGACQYRVMPPLPAATLPPTPFPAPVGNNGKEFCRGLGCNNLQGWPNDMAMGGYNLNCAHLYNDLLGGLKGSEMSRTLLDVRDSVVAICKQRVGPLEVGACPTYADVTVAAMAQKADAVPVGKVQDVCSSVYLFTLGARQAMIDLKLIDSALPPSKQASFLSTDASSMANSLNRFGTGGVGPNSPRGRRWRAWAWEHHRPLNYYQGEADVPLQPLATPQDQPSWVQWAASVWSGGAHRKGGLSEEEEFGTGCETSQIPGATPDDLTPRGKPKYNQNPPCANGVNVIPESNMNYQILPGSADGTVGPVEVHGGLFTYCRDQMSEIMMGFAQTAPMVITMTKDWCGYMASVTSWVGQAQEYGHPDWSFRNCEGMTSFLSFALRDQINSDEGLGAAQVCKKVFLSIGAVNRWDEIIDEAWTMSLRTSPTFAGTSTKPNKAMEALMKQVQAYTDQLFSKLRGQKAGFDALNGAKAATRDFDPSSVQVKPAPPPPSLPDSDDVGVFLTTSTSRLRRWGGLVGR